MHLKFSKCLRLLIWSSSMQINFQLLSLVLVVDFIEVSPDTASSASDKYSSSASEYSSSGHFFYLFSPIDSDLYCVKLCYLSYFSSYFSSRRLCLFSHVDFFFLVLSISYFSSSWFCELSWLFFLINFVNCRDWFFVGVELPIIRFFLVALSFRPPFNNSRRRYIVYELTISTNYQYSVHNRIYFNTLSPWLASSY